MPYKDPEKARLAANVRVRNYQKRDPERHKRQQKSRRDNNPETMRAKAQRHYAKHKDTMYQKARKRIAQNPEATKQYLKNYYQEHRAERKIKTAAYYTAHREKTLTDVKAYRAKHPDLVHAISTRYRAHKLYAPVNDFTAAQWTVMKAHYGHRCVYCDRKMQRLTMDHLTPLSQGGSHTQANIVPACQSCNSKKSTGPLLKPVQPLLL